jgi:hypothetical protein
MATLKIEKLGYLEFNRPAKGYVFDTDKRRFAYLVGIENLTEFLTYVTLLKEKAYSWFNNLPWQPEKDLLNH